MNHSQTEDAYQIRVLALGVLYQALLDAVREARGLRGENGEHIVPSPSRWTLSDACRVWCEIAGVNPDAFRSPVVKAIENHSGLKTRKPLRVESSGREMMI